MKKLGVGIIGCGWAGNQHARAYSSLGDVELVSVADEKDEAARKLSKKWGFKTCHKDYKKLLADPKVDVVSICLPIYLHADATVKAAEAGKHVLCEKPMACSLAEAEKMIEAADKAGVTLMIGETVRFNPVNLKIKDLIDRNIIGEIFLARIFRDHEMHNYLRRRPWMLDKRKAFGGIWSSGGVHDVDVLRMLVGEVETVSLFKAKSMLPEMEGDDTSAAILKFENGALGVVTESFSTKTFRSLAPNGCPSIINGSNGTITVHQNEVEVYGEKTHGPNVCLRIKVEPKGLFAEEIRHFLNCVRTGRKPVTSGEDQRRTLAVICAGYESLSKNSVPVKVKY